MCNRYVSPDQAAMERYCELRPTDSWRGGDIFNRKKGPFIRRTRDDPGYSRELVVGQWALIPWFAKSANLTYSTNNARAEELTSKASYKLPWTRGQRCIIPALNFDEPCYETGKNVWWRIRRVDGDVCALAGLWNTWTEKTTGEVHESYTMLTINADQHPLMSRMHKPDLTLPPDKQDKRSVVPIELDDVDIWLTGTREEALALLRPPAADVFAGEPLSPIKQRT